VGKALKLESKRISIAKCIRLLSRPRPQVREASRLTPELKEFIDRVVVPILVQTYLSELQNEKQIAENSAGMALCE
jgi:hypothetical protein